MILCILYFSANASNRSTRYKYTVSILFVGGLKDIFIQAGFNLTIIIERKHWDTYSCCECVISYRLNKKLRHFFALRRCACEFPFTTLINYVHGMKVYDLCSEVRRIHHYKLIPRQMFQSYISIVRKIWRYKVLSVHRNIVSYHAMVR